MADIQECRNKYLEGDVATVEENVKAFAANYGNVLCKAINDGRSNAQTGLKKEYLARKLKGSSDN